MYSILSISFDRGQGTISKLAVCYDDNSIFTAGEDGSFVVYEVKDKDCRIKTEILDPAE
jgi:hypothetical protein